MRVRYEFGITDGVATTLDGGFVICARSIPGNPYDGRTLAQGRQLASIT